MCASFFQSSIKKAQKHSAEKCRPNVLVSSLQSVGSRPVTHSHSNHTSISCIQWPGKRQRSAALRALGGLQRHDDEHKLGHREGESAYGNPAVSMETAVLTQLLPPHLDKYAAIRERHVLLCAGRIIKYSQSVSLFPPPCLISPPQVRVKKCGSAGDFIECFSWNWSRYHRFHILFERFRRSVALPGWS